MRAQILAASALLAIAASASADTIADAEKLFQEGQRLRAAGKLAEACTAFEGSQRIDPSNATLMNLADCRERNQQLATAWGMFLQVASKARGDAALAAAATKRAATVEPRMSHLIINVPDDSRIDGLAITRNGEPVDPAIWNRAMPIDGGRYVIVAMGRDHEPWQAEVVVANANDKQSVDVPRFKVVSAHPVASKQPTAPAPAPSAGLTGKRTLAIGLGAATVLSVGGAVGAELWGRRGYDAYKAAPDDEAREGLYRTANRRHHAAQGLAIGGAVLGVAATYLWLTGAAPAHERAPIAMPLLAPGLTGLAVTGGF